MLVPEIEGGGGTLSVTEEKEKKDCSWSILVVGLHNDPNPSRQCFARVSLMNGNPFVLSALFCLC